MKRHQTEWECLKSYQDVCFRRPPPPAGRPPPGGSSVCRRNSLIAALNVSPKAPSHSFQPAFASYFGFDRSQNATETTSSFFMFFFHFYHLCSHPPLLLKRLFTARGWSESAESDAAPDCRMQQQLPESLKGIIPRSKLAVVVEVHCRGRCRPG